MEVKGNAVPFYGMMVYKGVKAEFCQITVTINGGQWSTQSPNCSIPGNDFQYPLIRRLGGPKKSGLDDLGKIKSLFPLQGSSSPYRSQYTDYAIS